MAHWCRGFHVSVHRLRVKENTARHFSRVDMLVIVVAVNVCVFFSLSLALDTCMRLVHVNHCILPEQTLYYIECLASCVTERRDCGESLAKFPSSSLCFVSPVMLPKHTHFRVTLAHLAQLAGRSRPTNWRFVSDLVTDLMDEIDNRGRWRAPMGLLWIGTHSHRCSGPRVSRLPLVPPPKYIRPLPFKIRVTTTKLILTDYLHI